MAYLIGTDEAGYGPNLGPLVVSATLWQVPEGLGGEELYGRLHDVIAPTPGGAGPTRVAMADSKILYQPGKGLRHLERGLLAALELLGLDSELGPRPATWREVWDRLDGQSAAAQAAVPWYATYDAPVPLSADPAEIAPLGRTLRKGFLEAGVRLLAIHSRAVFPEQFNRLVARYDSKGAALSHLTLDLIAEIMAPLEHGPIQITCDKHGGRNRYAKLLAEHFPERLIEIHGEGRQRSVYRFGHDECRVEICFRTKAEACLPVALASMASKYLRELAMRAFNAFWCGRVAGLRPTAGYPGDARRFKADIAAVQAELAIEDGILWRER
jgi:ribonuclease HII